jgi:hypothetical protein
MAETTVGMMAELRVEKMVELLAVSTVSKKADM